MPYTDDKQYLMHMTKYDPEAKMPLHILPQLMNYLSKGQMLKIPRHATIIFARDRSGSMGTWEVGVCTHMSNWLTVILREIYSYTRTLYVTYGTEGAQVDGGTFAHQSTSGGTIVSTGVQVVRDLVNEADPKSDIFVFLMSDGDNLTSDNHRVMNMLENDLLDRVKFFGYFEANQYSRSSTLMSSLRHIDNPKFEHFTFRESHEYLWALQTLIAPLFIPGDSNAENEQRLQSFDDWALQ